MTVMIKSANVLIHLNTITIIVIPCLQLLLLSHKMQDLIIINTHSRTFHNEACDILYQKIVQKLKLYCLRSISINMYRS